MLEKALKAVWEGLGAAEIAIAPTFASNGLTLGAGTVLAKALDGGVRLDGVEARLLALLSVAYGGQLARERFATSNESGWTIFDDCQRTTGIMVEAKGPTFAKMWRNSRKSPVEWRIDAGLLKQSADQLIAAGPRSIEWFFSDADIAQHTRGLFDAVNQGRKAIQVLVEPYRGEARSASGGGRK